MQKIKKQKWYIPIGIAILIIIIVVVIFNILENSNKPIISVNDFTNLEELIEYNDCKYIKTANSKEEGYEKVKLVILLGVPESMEDDTVLVRLYDEILAIGKDVGVIDKIRSMKSYKELLLYITEENNIFR